MKELWIVAGQSNMVGFSGSAVDSIGLDLPDSRIKMFSRGIVKPQYTVSPANTIMMAQQPMQFNKITVLQNDISPALEFGKKRLESGITNDILILPAAVDSTGFINNHWNQGGTYYNQLVTDYNFIAANFDYPLAGILWMQGENDVNGNNTDYQNDLINFVNNLRSDLSGNSVLIPFIVGTMPQTWVNGQPAIGQQIQNILLDVPNFIVNGHSVNCTDLGSSGNIIHYSAVSYREIGRRLGTKANIIQNLRLNMFTNTKRPSLVHGLTDAQILALTGVKNNTIFVSSDTDTFYFIKLDGTAKAV